MRTMSVYVDIFNTTPTRQTPIWEPLKGVRGSRSLKNLSVLSAVELQGLLHGLSKAMQAVTQCEGHFQVCSLNSITYAKVHMIIRAISDSHQCAQVCTF